MGCSYAGAGARSAVEARRGLLVDSGHDDTRNEHASLQWLILEHVGEQSNRDGHQASAAVGRRRGPPLVVGDNLHRVDRGALWRGTSGGADATRALCGATRAATPPLAGRACRTRAS